MIKHAEDVEKQLATYGRQDS